MLQVKGISSVDPECCALVTPQPEAQHEQPQGQQLSHAELLPRPVRSQTQRRTQRRSHAGPAGAAGATLRSHPGSSSHLSADSACCSSLMPGRGFNGLKKIKPPTMPQWGRKCHPNVTSAGMGRVADFSCHAPPLRWMRSRVGMGRFSGASLTDRSQIKQSMFSQLGHI